MLWAIKMRLLTTLFPVALIVYCQQASFAIDKRAYAASQKPSHVLRIPQRASSSLAISTHSGAYITGSLEDNGRFTIGTVIGDPGLDSDDNQDLIFGHPSPGTSDTMIRVDGVSTSIHGGTSSNVSISGDSLSVTLTVGEIEVLERLTIRTSEATGRKDTIEIYFKVTNTGAGAHDVSLRTQLDTLLGSNDGAPFRVPNVGEVTHDLEFDNDAGTAAIDDIPAQTLVLDNLISPAIVALMTFTGLGYTTPDRLVFGYWPVSVGQWDYVVDSNRSFLDNDGDGTITGSSPDSDSSVIVWWGYPDGNAFNLGPGQSQEFAMLYGIGNCAYKSEAPFTILFCAPAAIEGQVSGATYTYTPVNVTAFLTNNTASTVSGGRAQINLTPDFKLVSGYSQSYPIEGSPGSGTVGANGTAQIDWQMTSNGRQLGERYISISVDAGRHYGVRRSIFTKTIPNLLYGQATDQNGNPISGATVSVLRGGAVVATTTTQSDGTYSVSGLSPGMYTVRITVGGSPDTYVTAVVSDTEVGGATGNPGRFAAASTLSAFVYPNPVREGRAHITYYTEAAEAPEIQVFSSAGQLIETLSHGESGAGWHTVDWPIDQVANGVYFYQVSIGKDRARGKLAVIKRRGM